MSLIASARIYPDAPAPVAPRWHTALLIVLFLSLAAGGALMQRQAQGRPVTPAGHPNVIPLYLSLIAAEWGLLVYVWKGGLRRGGTTLGDLIGGRWNGAKDALRDGALALGAWTAWMGFEKAWALGLGPDPAASIQALLPRRPIEILLWIGVSTSAGVVEETVFRGYFQKQFEALTRSRSAALILQASLFGISHGYQGLRACFKIAVYGLLFGALALWRKSLRPGMMAHAWTDIAAGIL